MIISKERESFITQEMRDLCGRWIDLWLEPSEKKWDYLHSYKLKHLVERHSGVYIRNEAAIVVMYEKGFKLEAADRKGTNFWFYCKPKFGMRNFNKLIRNSPSADAFRYKHNLKNYNNPEFGDVHKSESPITKLTYIFADVDCIFNKV